MIGFNEEGYKKCINISVMHIYNSPESAFRDAIGDHFKHLSLQELNMTYIPFSCPYKSSNKSFMLFYFLVHFYLVSKLLNWLNQNSIYC